MTAVVGHTDDQCSDDRGGDGHADVTLQLDAVTTSIAALTAAIEHHADYDTVLQQLCEAAVDAVPAADIAAITVLRRGSASTAACTDEVALDVDAAQYGTGQGPCLDAALTQSLVRAGGAEVAQRWPVFAERTEPSKVSSYLSAPILLDDDTAAGALNLYSFDYHGFSDLDVAMLRVYLIAIGTALRGVVVVDAARTELDGLHTAMKTRAIIEQAKGIVMALQHISAESAFAFLCEQSQNTNTKVHTLAQTIVDAAYQG